ncbi:DNA polymerase/3'-5' exonuclease PolX, partial [Candidatus Woesearchaeota archaeon]|nr:DNA polymerase/3'-5' exonuclease PolX [Candidatus Woesearchaeota archaeon]
MINSQIADIFEEMADIFEVKEVKWKPAAYRKAARAIRALSQDVKTVYKKGGLDALEEISGVGESLAKKIEEFIKKGKIKEYAKLKKDVPAGFEEIISIPGMGPKKAQKLYKKLKIKSIGDLKKAVKKGKIRKLEGFGEKTEQDILEGIGLVSKRKERPLLGNILPIAQELKGKLKKKTQRIEIAGSLRRMKETVHDIDLLAIASKP